MPTIYDVVSNGRYMVDLDTCRYGDYDSNDDACGNGQGSLAVVFGGE